MNKAQSLIEAFGGLSSFAQALGHKHPTTVQGWGKSGRIPHWRHDEIFRAAEAAGKLSEVKALLGDNAP